VADLDDENPSFDELKPLDEHEEQLEEAAPVEPEPPAEDVPSSIFEGVDASFLSDLPGADEDSSIVAAPLESAEFVEGEQAEVDEARSVEMVAEAAEEAKPKQPTNMATLLEWGGVIGIPVILLGLAALQVLSFATVLYVISVGFVPYGVWKGRETNNVYTIILACSLVAVLTAVFCLWLEIARYHADVKAREAKQRVSMSWPTDTRFLADLGNRPPLEC